MTNQQIVEVSTIGLIMASSFTSNVEEKVFDATALEKLCERLPGLEYDNDSGLFIDPSIPIDFYDFECQSQLGINRQILVYQLHRKHGFDKYIDDPELFLYASPAEQKVYEDFRLNNKELNYLWDKQITEAKIRDNIFMYDVYDPILDEHIQYEEVRPTDKVVTVLCQAIF